MSDALQCLFPPCVLWCRAQEAGEEVTEATVDRRIGDEIQKLLTLRASAKIR